jgi:hypothetical protein
MNMLTQEVTQFMKQDDIAAYEQISAEARELMQRLGDNSDLAKTYNMRESLTDNDETSYENVH